MTTPPKRRHSRARSRKRRTHWKVPIPGLSRCPNCGEYKLPHRVCPNCGYYGGGKKEVREIIVIEKEKKSEK
ncbi:50S ribosomal protein L32 [Candidatus Pacearchaeota archaeon]|nr:MAG: 50S ribosomal protein L32 [Candidatus Pacearchaeota archaeon]